MSYLIDLSSEYYANNSGAAVWTGGFPTSGQSFLNPVDNILESVVFSLNKLGSPTGFAYAQIFAHSGVFGTSSVGVGAALATSLPFDVSTLTTSFALYTFTFTGLNKIKLAANTNYVVVLTYNGGFTNNFPFINITSSTNTHPGNRTRANSAGVWTADNTNDACFYVYGSYPPANPLNLGGDMPLNIPKYYIYKVYDYSGNYLGTFKNVTSEFGYNQPINTTGTEVDITLAQLEKDTLTVNGNLVQVYEYSGYYPNGLLKFSGYISKTKLVVGSNNSILLTCLSHGQDLTQIYVSTGDTAFLSQATDTSSVFTDDNTATNRPGVAQTFTVASNINLSSISLEVALISQYYTAGTGLYMSVYKMIGASPNAAVDTLIGSGRYLISNDILTKTVVNIAISEKPALTTGNTYYFKVGFNLHSGTAAPKFYYATGNPYASGSAYTVTDIFTATPTFTVSTNNDLYFVIYQLAGGLSGSFTNTPSSLILSSVIAAYNSSGGIVQRPYNYFAGAVGFPSTFASVTYTFKLQTVADGLNSILSLSPANWYYYVDPATNIIYMDQMHSYPDVILTAGRHIDELEIESTKEGLVNTVYFVGGDDGTGTSTNIFVSKTAAVGSNRIGTVLLTDNRVNSTTGGLTTARAIAQNYLDNNSSERYNTTVTIRDRTCDINLFHLGQVVGFNGFNDFVDSLLMQIVGLRYSPDSVTLTLGTLIKQSTKLINDINASLTKTQTLNAPILPS